MELFQVNYMGYSGDYSILMVGKSEEEVKERAYEIDDQCYSIGAYEIKEVDGYKITLSK